MVILIKQKMPESLEKLLLFFKAGKLSPQEKGAFVGRPAIFAYLLTRQERASPL